jgi:hypothetical protein
MAKKYQPFEKAGTKLSLFEIISSNFIGGIAWALGATIGLSLIFALLGLVAKNVNLVPIVGSFVSQVLNFVMANNPHLQK